MSHIPPKRSLPASSKKPRADFNWPPTEGELTQYYSVETLQSETARDGTGVKTAEPSVAPASLAPHATSVVPPETPARLPIPAIAQETSPLPVESGGATARDREATMSNRHKTRPSPSAFFEPRHAVFDCPPGDEGPTRSDAEDPTHPGIEDSTTSGIAVAQSETARDGSSAGESSAEIAHLQALIEELTQMVAWRVTNVTGR